MLQNTVTIILQHQHKLTFYTADYSCQKRLLKE